MSSELINKALEVAKEKFVSEEVAASDLKSKAKILKTLIKDLALESNVNLS